MLCVWEGLSYRKLFVAHSGFGGGLHLVEKSCVDLMHFGHGAGSAEGIGGVEAGIHGSLHLQRKVLAGRKSLSYCMENILYRSELVLWAETPECLYFIKDDLSEWVLHV